MLKSKKGFTIVELVIVIAVIAILAAVLIPSFSSLNKKAKDSAYLQERTNQQIADLAEKVENQKFLTWEDLEAKLAEEIAKVPAGADPAKVEEAIAKAIAKFENSLKTDDTALTEAQVKAIIEKALEGQLTTAQVEAIVNAAVDSIAIPEVKETVTTDQIKAIIDNAVAGLDKQTGITADEMKDAITAAMKEQTTLSDTDVETIINNALNGFGYGNDLSASQIENIINNAMGISKLKADELAAQEMSKIVEGTADVEAAAKALSAAGYNVNALTPIITEYIFCYDADATDGKIKCVKESEIGDMDNILVEGASFIIAEVKDADKLKTALERGNDVTLTADVSGAAEIIIPEGADVTLDLGGFNYTTEKANAGDKVNQRSKYIIVSEGATVTIQNGTFEGRGIEINDGAKLIIGEGAKINQADYYGGACLWVCEGAEVVVDGGEFAVSNGMSDWYSDPVIISNFGGKITINSGKFETANNHSYIINNRGGEIIINGGEFYAYRGVVSALAGTVTINDGTFAVTNGAESGWIAYTEGSGAIVLNGGEYSTVTGNKFTGNVTGAKAQ